MKILVTGSAGNIGRKLVPYLRKCGHEVKGFDLKKGESLFYFEGKEDLCNVFNIYKFDVVYHLAALAGRKRCEEQRETALKVNVLGTHKICKLCLEYGCKLIHFSTSEVYGNIPHQDEEEELCPENWYGVTKKMGEEVVRYYGTLGLKYIIVRPFMIYDEDEDFGEYRSAIIRFAENIIRGDKIEVHEDTDRGWLHIDDAVIVFERLFQKDGVDIINIGNPDVRPMQMIAEEMLEIIGMDISSCDGYDLIDQPKRMIRSKWPNLSRQQQLLNYQPQITLEEGLKRVIKRVKERLA